MTEKEEKQVISQATIQIPQDNNTITLLEALQILWDKKWTLFLFLLAGLIVGFSLANWLRPQFTSDILLQVDAKGGKSGRAIGDMGALLDVASPADAEIELIRSRMVLSYVVEAERLCFNATPIGAVDRFTHKEGRMDLDSLYIPVMAQLEKWRARVTSPETFEVLTEDDQVLLTGKVGAKTPEMAASSSSKTSRLKRALKLTVS